MLTYILIFYFGMNVFLLGLMWETSKTDRNPKVFRTFMLFGGIPMVLYAVIRVIKDKLDEHYQMTFWIMWYFRRKEFKNLKPKTLKELNKRAAAANNSFKKCTNLVNKLNNYVPED